MNGERRVRLVGIDVSPHAVGRHFCDAFYVVPPTEDPAFAETVLRITEQEGVDVVLPQSSADVAALAAHRDALRQLGVAALVSAPEAVRRVRDLPLTYALLEQIGVPSPAWRRVFGGRGLRTAAQELGYPDRLVCFRPIAALGSASRVLDATAQRGRQLLDVDSANSAVRLTEALDALPEDGGPELLVFEHTEGRPRSVEGIARDGDVLLAYTKAAEPTRDGPPMYFELVDDPRLVELGSRIVEELRADHFFHIDLIGDLVVAVNLWISSLVYQKDLNLPYLGVKHALGELSDAELGAHEARIRSTRRALRYFDQVEWDEITPEAAAPREPGSEETHI